MEPIVSDTDDEAIMRLTGRLVLDHVTAVRFGFDLLDALIFSTITQANVDPITRDPELQLRYATYDHPPPDHLRRPISINAVAQSLGIPFETIRRRVVKMSVLRLYKASKLGVISPAPMLRNRRNRMVQESAYRQAQTLHAELDRGGWGEAYPEVAPWTGPEPLRLVARVTGEYLLRLVHLLMDETGDPLGATVWLAIFCDNVAVRDRGGDRAIPGGQTPMSTAALARRLRLSTETVRRRIQTLVAQGLCVQSGATAVVDASVLARPGVQRLLTRNRQDVRRTYQTLAEYGIPQGWREAEAPAASVAA
jgi:DNA-binding Lrp family transcriptional regulator